MFMNYVGDNIEKFVELHLVVLQDNFCFEQFKDNFPLNLFI